jgi:hypothetical protein
MKCTRQVSDDLHLYTLQLTKIKQAKAGQLVVVESQLLLPYDGDASTPGLFSTLLFLSQLLCFKG